MKSNSALLTCPGGRLLPATLMDPLSRVPFSDLSRACSNFSPANKIGEGSTGAVFLGRLGDLDVALKRLCLPEGASPEARAALARAFNAELLTLSTYRHPRLVRLLCHAIDEEAGSRHPIVLAFELLQEGSLADHLRGPNGEARRAPGPPLTPLERVDAALGAAAGLAYLHGLPEDAEPGGGGGGGQPQAPVLHRDVKAAHIGFTRVAGELYAKLLDCGLVIGHTGSVVGTPGYMAPELAWGVESPRSDIYGLGCVLLELLRGARVGPSTARELEEAANEDGEGVGAVRACAEACWPPAAADALAALALACIHHRPKKRPEGVGEVLGALRALRALLAPPSAPLLPCTVCGEDVAEAGGLRCCSPPAAAAAAAGGAPSHFCCHGCLQGHVRSRLELAALRASGGHIPCVQAGCGAAWRGEDMAEALDKGTWAALYVALRRLAIDGPRERAAEAAAWAAAWGAAAQLQPLAARAAELRRIVAERDLLLRCPGCWAVFQDYAGCNALACGRCGTGFCAVCLADCGSTSATHQHYREVHGREYFDKPLFERTVRARYLARLAAAVRAAGPLPVQLELVQQLARADLRDLGIEQQEVLEAAGVAGEQQQQQQQQQPVGAGAGAAPGAGSGSGGSGSAPPCAACSSQLCAAPPSAAVQYTNSAGYHVRFFETGCGSLMMHVTNPPQEPPYNRTTPVHTLRYSAATGLLQGCSSSGFVGEGIVPQQLRAQLLPVLAALGTRPSTRLLGFPGTLSYATTDGWGVRLYVTGPPAALMSQSVHPPTRARFTSQLLALEYSADSGLLKGVIPGGARQGIVPEEVRAEVLQCSAGLAPEGVQLRGYPASAAALKGTLIPACFFCMQVGACVCARV